MNSYDSSAFAALILRVALGTMFVAHGSLKLLVFTLAGTAEFFAAVGFPAWLAYPVTFAEIAGGALLILGVQTRAVSVALLPIVLGAISVHFANGWVYTNANGGWEYAAFLSAAVVAQALLGDGAFALQLGRRELPGTRAEPAVS
jgi:putative oxidoreductase